MPLTDKATRDEGEDLTCGDVGALLHVHPGGDAYVLDSLTHDGSTDGIGTVLPSSDTGGTRADMSHTRLTETSA